MRMTGTRSRFAECAGYSCSIAGLLAAQEPRNAAQEMTASHANCRRKRVSLPLKGRERTIHLSQVAAAGPVIGQCDEPGVPKMDRWTFLVLQVRLGHR